MIYTVEIHIAGVLLAIHVEKRLVSKYHPVNRRPERTSEGLRSQSAISPKGEGSGAMGVEK